MPESANFYYFLGDDMTAIREKFLDSLLTSKSIKDAAAAAGMPLNSAYKIMKSVEFKTALNNRLAIIANSSIARVKALTARAVDILRAGLNSHEYETRYRAACKVLDIYFRYLETIELNDRVKALETKSYGSAAANDIIIYPPRKTNGQVKVYLPDNGRDQGNASIDSQN